MQIIKIVLGLFLLLAAWGYIFHKKLIYKINAWMRDFVFNDQTVLFSGRRVAILLVILGVLALFSGMQDLIKISPLKPQIAAQILDQARHELANKRYTSVVQRCRFLVKANPDSVEAWELLVTALSALGEKEKAKQAVEILLRISPNHPLGKAIFKVESEKIHREKRDRN